MLKIFCEGIGDQVFIADFIEEHFNIVFKRSFSQMGGKNSLNIISDNIEIIPIDGCKKIHQKIIKQKFINNTELGGVNLLIFDADFVGVNGNNGYSNCTAMMENLKNHPTDSIEFTYYLWPDNENDGLFENLLEGLIPANNKVVINCIEAHYSCLTALKNVLPIRLPGIKEKINNYLHLFKEKTQLDKRSYKNPLWHLDTTKSNELNLFKDFLSKHI